MEPILQLHIDLRGVRSRGLANHLYESLALSISRNEHGDGVRLPSTREFAAQLGVSRNTVINVYERLTSEGYVEVRLGSGYYTIAQSGPVPAQADVALDSRAERHLNKIWDRLPVWGTREAEIAYDFTPAIPDTDHFPVDIWRRLCARANRGQRLGYSAYAETQGRLELRKAIAFHLKIARSMLCNTEDVIVTSGTQQAAYLLACILVTPGKTVVAFEDPGYRLVRQIFQLAGAIIVDVPVDQEGMIVELIPQNADIIFTTPSHQYPMGYAMSQRRRLKLIEHAKHTGSLIIEDDYQGEYTLDENPLYSLKSGDQSQSIFYIGTFSKTMFPELRLGFVVAPNWAIASLLKAKRIVDIESPHVLQDALAQFISDGHLSRHVRRMRKVYAEKRALMVKCLEAHCNQWVKSINGDGGLYISVEFINAVSATEVAKIANAEHIRVYPLQIYASSVPDVNGLIIGLGRLPLEKIESAVCRMAEIIRRTTSADLRVPA